MLSPGHQVDRFEVEAILGQGGMAVVYRVRHATLGSLHALKVLTVHSPGLQSRLVQEGRMQATLRHENIVAVHDIVDVNGFPGLVMDWVDGPDLEHWLQRNRPDLDTRLRLFIGVLRGVHRAHRAGLVHRDLKPGNILVAQGEEGPVPKVADFGLAKVVSAERPDAGHHTRTGATMGTPGYMAPEQVRNAKDVDQRADIWALGCILYRLATDALPFGGLDTVELLNNICAAAYTPPEKLRVDLPAPIGDAIRGCLVVDRDQRIPDCPTLLAVLQGEQTWSAAPVDAGIAGGATLADWVSEDSLAPPEGSLSSRDTPAPTAAPLVAPTVAPTQAPPAPPTPAPVRPRPAPPAPRAGRSGGVGWLMVGLALLGALGVGTLVLLVVGIALWEDAGGDMVIDTGSFAPTTAASWSLQGDVPHVVLADAYGTTYGPGPVPPGMYTVAVMFDGVNPIPTGTMQLLPGQSLVLTCSRAAGACY